MVRPGHGCEPDAHATGATRGPIPTLAYQKAQIRRFAAHKINVYSPYYEHSLAYAANPLIAPPRGAMTRDDVRELIAYAAKYHIDVIPEQEAFGHLHHVLKYEIYSDLAETPHSHVLAPGKPGSMALITSWFAEIDSLFTARFVHIGADETVELGRGQTRDRVKAEGLGRVYLQFVRDINTALKPSGKRLMFWADIAMESPQLVGILPKEMVAVCWDYWSFNGFDRCLKPFADVGMETWVAPGVNNWNRVYPYNAVALRNIQAFVRDGQKLGATGVLNTNWDDDGDALFEQLWAGVLFGAAAGWQAGESSIPINAQTNNDLNDIASSLSGRISDLKEGYVLGREVYEHAWANENRPTYLGNLTNRYDAAAQLWIQRSDRIREAMMQFRRNKTLPPMEELGIPRPVPVP